MNLKILDWLSNFLFFDNDDLLETFNLFDFFIREEYFHAENECCAQVLALWMHLYTTTTAHDDSMASFKALHVCSVLLKFFRMVIDSAVKESHHFMSLSFCDTFTFVCNMEAKKLFCLVIRHFDANSFASWELESIFGQSHQYLFQTLIVTHE